MKEVTAGDLKSVVRSRSGVTTVKLEGSFQGISASDFTDLLLNCIDDKYIIFDLQNLDQLGASGIDVISRVFQTSGRQVVICNPQARVMGLLRTTQLHTLINIRVDKKVCLRELFQLQVAII